MRPYSILAGVVILALTSSAALYQDYNDTVGDIVNPGDPHLDIQSVRVAHEGSALSFSVNLGGNMTAGGRYYLGIDSKAGGDVQGNPWDSPIGMSSGMDYFVAVGYYPSSSTYQADFYRWSGASWSLVRPSTGDTPVLTANSSSYTLAFQDYSTLGVSPGTTLKFDAYTTGGYGANAVDALSNPNMIPDGTAYNTGLNYKTFDVTAVPETSHYGLICAGGLLGLATVQTWRKRKAA